MTMLLGLVDVDAQEDDDPGLTHVFCGECYPKGEKTFCGTLFDTDSDELDYNDGIVVDCVVCADIDVCPECGQ